MQQQHYKYQNDYRLYLIIALMIIIGAVSKHSPSTEKIVQASHQQGGVVVETQMIVMYLAAVVLILIIGFQSLHFYIESKKVSSDGHWEKHKRISLQPEVFDHTQA